MKVHFILVSALLMLAHVAQADIAVIVHPSNNNDLNEKTISRVFLGKMKKFSSGEKAIPYYLASGHASRDEFNKKVLKKSSSQLKAYWSKLIFTGKGNPPDSMGSVDNIIAKVASEPGAIAYVDVKFVTDGVKVIKTY